MDRRAITKEPCVDKSEIKAACFYIY